MSVQRKRGIKPKSKVIIKWSPNFAYIVGLITSDGCLAKNNSIINITSKDLELIEKVKKDFNLSNKVGRKGSGSVKGKPYYVIQFGDVNFCEFLNSIGIYPKKSKTIKKVDVPDKYFFDFLRGYFDGDGSTYSYLDKRWKSSFMFYTSFVSASGVFINFIRDRIFSFLHIKGHLTYVKNTTQVQLKYAKSESLILVDKMYENNPELYLLRKRLKINEILSTIASNKQDA